MRVQDVYHLIDSLAPYETQDSFDNSGLLVGDPTWEVRGIHVAMDVTSSVLDEAIQCGANLIVTHHPMMFTARKRLAETDSEARLLCRMIRHEIALIAAHTNLDQAPGGINDVLAQTIGLTNITGEAYVRIGELPAPMTAEAFALQAGDALHSVVRLMGDPGREIRRVAVTSGAGSDSVRDALAMGADAFLTGEAKHHHALEAAESGMLVFEAGHHATEEPGIFALADALQNHLNALQYKIHVSKSTARPYC